MALKTQHLTKQKNFEGVFSKGKAVREGELLLKTRLEGEEAAKFAIVVSKKVSKKAVVRNRIRRVLHEALRHEKGRIKSGVKAVLVVFPGFEDKGFQEARARVQRLLKKASLFQ